MKLRAQSAASSVKDAVMTKFMDSKKNMAKVHKGMFGNVSKDAGAIGADVMEKHNHLRGGMCNTVTNNQRGSAANVDTVENQAPTHTYPMCGGGVLDVANVSTAATVGDTHNLMDVVETSEARMTDMGDVDNAGARARHRLCTSATPARPSSTPRPLLWQRTPLA